jgi:hypothetical protein
LAKGDLPVGNVVVVLLCNYWTYKSEEGFLAKAKKDFSAEFTMSEVEWARNDLCSNGAVFFIHLEKRERSFRPVERL